MCLNSLLRRHFFARAISIGAAWSLSSVYGPVRANSSTIAIEDFRGIQTFPTMPRRVVALQWDSLENLVGLGITPVGAADIDSWDAWVVEPKLPSGIRSVGTRAEPNLERIAELNPDLIVIGPTQLDIVKHLEAIAPVLVFENFRATSPLDQAQTAFDQLDTLARLFGRETQARALRSKWNQTIESCRHRIFEHFGKMPEVQIIRFSSLTTAFVYTQNSIAEHVIDALGMKQPIRKPAADYGLTQVRLRDLKNLTEAYVLYIRPFAQEKKLLQSILWQATPFARKHRVAAVEPYWSHGGALSVEVTARRITQALLSIPVTDKD